MIKFIPILLIIIGVGIGLFSFYSYKIHEISEGPSLIGKDKAFDIAFEKGGWNEDMLSDKNVDAQLLHIKNDGFAFVVDEWTFEDKALKGKFPLEEGKYVWSIQITKRIGEYETREWAYMIDASNGAVLFPN